MDIKTFVTEALVQIVDGAKEGARRLPDAAICFDIRDAKAPGVGDKLDYVSVRGGFGALEYVAFDLAVTTGESSSTKGEGSLQVAGILNLGGGKGFDSEKSVVNRVQFRVPIAFPVIAREQATG